VDRNGDLAMKDDALGGFRELREGAVCGGAVDNWGRDRTEFCEEAEN